MPTEGLSEGTLAFDLPKYGAGLKRALDAAGLSYREAEQVIGVDHNTLQRVASGTRPPNVEHYLRIERWLAAPKPGEQAVSKETLKPCPFCGRAPKWVEIADARSAEMVGPWRKLTCSGGWNDETCRVSPFLQYHTDKWVQGKGTSRVNRDAEFGRIWNARAEGPAPPGGGGEEGLDRPALALRRDPPSPSDGPVLRDGGAE